MLNYNGNINPFAPNSQVVIPQITIPQNFQPSVMSQAPIVQITVKGKEAAQKYKFPPNSRGAIFDEDEAIFYYKETDASGNEVVFKTCSYVEVEDPPEPEYLTVQEFRSSMMELENRLREGFNNGEFVRASAGKHQATGE